MRRQAIYKEKAGKEAQNELKKEKEGYNRLNKALNLVFGVIIISLFLLFIIFKRWVALWVFIAVNLAFAGYLLYKRREMFIKVITLGSNTLLRAEKQIKKRRGKTKWEKKKLKTGMRSQKRII